MLRTRGRQRRTGAIGVTLRAAPCADTTDMKRTAIGPALSLFAMLVGLAPAAAAGAPPEAAPPAPASGLYRHELELGPRRLAVALQLQPPAPGSDALVGVGQLETGLALGARLVVRQPCSLTREGTGALGATRIELQRPLGTEGALLSGLSVTGAAELAARARGATLGAGLRLGPATTASLDLLQEQSLRDPAALSRLGRVAVEHRFSPATRLQLVLDVGAGDAAPGMRGSLRFERSF